jgi:hypothetical protein
MPSLSASIFGFATGIAIADKIDVVTSTHAARLKEQASHRVSPLVIRGLRYQENALRARLFPGMLLAACTDAAARPISGEGAFRKEPRADRDVTSAAVARP